jgi:hypothetical protein
VARTGSAARVIAVVICGGWIAAFFVGGGAQDWSVPGPWLFVGLPVVLALRSAFFGVYVNESSVKVVSWYRTYRLDRNGVQRVFAAQLQRIHQHVVGRSGPL